MVLHILLTVFIIADVDYLSRHAQHRMRFTLLYLFTQSGMIQLEGYISSKALFENGRRKFLGTRLTEETPCCGMFSNAMLHKLILSGSDKWFRSLMGESLLETDTTGTHMKKNKSR